MKANTKSLIIKLVVILSVSIILSSIAIITLADGNGNFELNYSSGDSTKVDTLVNNFCSSATNNINEIYDISSRR